ncbi:glycosyltransferase family 39 protein [bacterium]|nr:glycosyltransferase family 39 protein [bacterium]
MVIRPSTDPDLNHSESHEGDPPDRCGAPSDTSCAFGSFSVPAVAIPMTLSFILSIFSLSGFYVSDDATYLSSIVSLANGEPLLNSLGSVRYPLIVPGVLVYLLTKSSLLTICFGVLYHPLLVYVAYWMTRKLSNSSAGFIAGCLVAISPTLYLYSGTLLPDTPQAFWSALWLVAMYTGVQRGLSLRRRALWFFLASLCNGLAYFTKESGLLLAPLGALFAFFAPQLAVRQRFLVAVVYCGGIALCFLGEFLAIYLLSDQALWRLGVVGNEENTAALLRRSRSQGLYPGDRFAYWFQRVSRTNGESVLYLLGVVSVVYPFLPRRSWLVWCTAVWLFLYLTFGTTSFSSYLPPSIQDRYYAVIIVPAAIMIAQVLYFLFSLPVSVGSWLQNKKSQAVTENQEGRRSHRPSSSWVLDGGCALIGVVILFLGVIKAHSLDTYAGSVYRARQSRAFIEAFHIAKDEFPSLPIVTTNYLHRRLTPLLNINGHPALPTEPPGLAQPFILIRPYETGRELPNYPSLLNLEDESIFECARRISTSRTRLSYLIENNRELLQMIRPRNSELPEPSRDMWLQIFIPHASTGLSSAQRLPLFHLSPNWECRPAVRSSVEVL